MRIPNSAELALAAEPAPLGPFITTAGAADGAGVTASPFSGAGAGTTMAIAGACFPGFGTVIGGAGIMAVEAVGTGAQAAVAKVAQQMTAPFSKVRTGKNLLSSRGPCQLMVKFWFAPDLYRQRRPGPIAARGSRTAASASPTVPASNRAGQTGGRS